MISLTVPQKRQRSILNQVALM